MARQRSWPDGAVYSKGFNSAFALNAADGSLIWSLAISGPEPAEETGIVCLPTVAPRSLGAVGAGSGAPFCGVLQRAIAEQYCVLGNASGQRPFIPVPGTAKCTL
jgi:hypothetical protein